jgi:hypothetical protein
MMVGHHTCNWLACAVMLTKQSAEQDGCAPATTTTTRSAQRAERNCQQRVSEGLMGNLGFPMRCPWVTYNPVSMSGLC